MMIWRANGISALIVALSSSLFVFSFLLLASLFHADIREHERFQSRQFEPTNQTEHMVQFWGTGDIIAGRNFPVVLLEVPVNRSTPLPPGFSGPPQVGMWWISPALLQEASKNPNILASFKPYRVIDEEGVVSGSELIAYRWIEAGSQPLRGAPISVADWGEGDFSLAHQPFVMQSFELRLGGSLLVGVPALLASLMGIGAADRRSNARYAFILYELGATKSQLLWRAAVPLLPWAVIGWGSGWFAWRLLIAQQTAIPGIQHQFLPHDLMVQWEGQLGSFLCALFIAALPLIHSAYFRYGQGVRNRNTATHIQSIWRWLSPASLLLATLVKRWDGSTLMFYALLILALVSLPLFLPKALALLVDAFSGSFSFAGELALRQLLHDTIRSSRPISSIAVALAMLLLTTGYIALNRGFYITPEPTLAKTLVSVDLIGDRTFSSEELSAMVQKLPPGLMVPTYRSSDRQGPSEITLGAQCGSIEERVPEWDCNRLLGDRADTEYLQTSGIGIVAPSAMTQGLRFDDEIDAFTGFLYVTTEPQSGTYLADISASALRSEQILANVFTPESVNLTAPERLSWLYGGLITMCVVLGTIAILSFVIGSADLTYNLRPLALLGVRGTELSRIAMYRFVLLWSTGVWVGVGFGFLGAHAILLRRSSVGMPYLELAFAAILIWSVPLVAILWQHLWTRERTSFAPEIAS